MSEEMDVPTMKPVEQFYNSVMNTCCRWEKEADLTVIDVVGVLEHIKGRVVRNSLMDEDAEREYMAGE